MKNDDVYDLEGHYKVQRSKIVNHVEYSVPVLMTQFGWAKRGHETHWHETKIEPIRARGLHDMNKAAEQNGEDL